MAMSLEQPLTVEAPAEEEILEAATVPVTPEQSDDHPDELTPNAVVAHPIGTLTIDIDTETVVPSPTRRNAEISLRSRHKSALQ